MSFINDVKKLKFNNHIKTYKGTGFFTFIFITFIVGTGT